MKTGTRRAVGAALLAVLSLSAGCQMIATTTILLRPREIQKAEFEIPDGSRVAVVFDPPDSGDRNPVFEFGLFNRLERYFRQYNSTSRLVPLREVNMLERNHRADYSGWSLQRIGRELKADYVVHMKLNSLHVTETPGHPVLAPRVSMHMKVIATDQPADDARVWPDRKEGREVVCQRQSGVAASPNSVDAEMGRLGMDTAYFVMMPFFDVDLEEDRPVEPS